MWLYRLRDIMVQLTGWPCWGCVRFRVVMLAMAVAIIVLW